MLCLSANDGADTYLIQVISHNDLEQDAFLPESLKYVLQ